MLLRTGALALVLASAPLAQMDLGLAAVDDVGSLPALTSDSWSPPITWRADSGWYATAAHATLLGDGRVLLIGYQRDTFDPPTVQGTRFVGAFTPTPAGQPVPDEVVIELVRQRLGREDCAPGFILDGFPRTADQAKVLDEILRELGRGPVRVVCLDVPEQELVDRILSFGLERVLS